MCDALGVDGGHLPDEGFYGPTVETESSPALDIFSLGSIYYTIMAATWPFRSPGGFKCGEDKAKYEQEVHALFRQRIYPDVSTLLGGEVILGCWKKKYKTAQEVLDAFEEVEQCRCRYIE